MKTFRLTVLLVCVLWLTAHASWAGQSYVTDSFRITLRRGPSTEHKILRFLSSGDPVEVLKSQGNWSLVHPSTSEKTSVDGWVLSRYLTTRRPWAIQARSLQQENARLKEKLSRTEREYKKFKKQQKADYHKLQSLSEAAQHTIQTLTDENKALKSSHKKQWFALGALVLLSGLIFGVLFGLAIGRKQKKRSLSI